MKNQHYIDELFKNRLEGYSTEVPESMFKEILKKRALQRSAKKDRRILLLILFLVVVAGGSYLIPSGVFTKNSNPILATSLTETAESIITSENTDYPLSTDNNQKQSELKSIILASDQSQINDISANTSKTYTQEVQNLDGTEKSGLLLPEEVQSKETVAIHSELLNEKVSKVESIAQSRANWTNSLSMLPGVEPLIETTDQGEERSYEDLFKIGLSKTDKNCYNFSKTPSVLSLDAYFGPEYAIRSFTARSSEAIDYVDERDESEKFNHAFSGGIRVSIHAPRGFAFRTGIEYNQISEQFNYVNSRSTMITVDSIFNADGSFSRLAIDTIYGTRIKTTYNRFHMIDVPLIIGYEIISNRWAIDFNGGAFVNLVFRQRGDFLDPSGNPVSFSSSDNNPYPAFDDTVGFSLFGSIAFKYSLTDRVQVLLEPRVKYYLNSFTINSYPLQQEYLTTGLMAGLRFKF